MIISSNWIKELVPGLALSGKEIAQLLTDHSFETVVEREYAIDPNITVVQILKLEQHPNADRLRLATITDGTQELTVVCGAPNISEGDVVPYSPPGTKVYDEAGELFELSVAKIRGVESPGMLNSPRELGLSHDHGGILLLPNTLPLGSKLADHIASDVLLEVDVLPDRAHDCLSHIGIAREVAALTRLAVQEPSSMALPEAQVGVDGYTVRVDNAQHASRYVGIVFNNTSSDSVTPLLMQVRLLSLGMRLVHPVVDITNYVTLEYGNPSHAFDAAKLPGKEISVVETKTDFMFHAVDGKEYKPALDDLLIQSGGETVALAGVIGGASTAVDETTKHVFLEIATFHAFAIQEAAQHTGLRTEASIRFSKGLHPLLAGIAASRLAQLMSDIVGANIVGVLDTNPHPDRIRPIVFRPARASSYAGVEISNDDAEDSLTRLGFSIEKSSDHEWEVLPPALRLDVLGEHDIIDEVVRMVGLNNIPASNAASRAHALPLAEEIYWQNKIRELLVQLGFTETYSYSFEDKKYADLVDASRHPHVAIANPIAPEFANMRYSMLPGLLAVAVKNREEFHREKKSSERALFEMGRVYHVGDGGQVPGVIERKPVSMIMVGDEHTLQETVDALCDLFGISGYETKTGEKPFGTSKMYIYGGEFLATGYILSQDLLKKLKYRMPLVALEMSIPALVKHAADVEIPARTLEDIRASFKQPIQFTELPKFPSVFRDISILVASDTKIDQVQQEINRVGGILVVGVDLFDEFMEEGSDTKSLAFHIEYRSSEKTLNDSEITEIHKKIEHALKKQFQAEIR